MASSGLSPLLELILLTSKAGVSFPICPIFPGFTFIGSSPLVPFVGSAFGALPHSLLFYLGSNICQFGLLLSLNVPKHLSCFPVLLCGD